MHGRLIALGLATGLLVGCGGSGAEPHGGPAAAARAGGQEEPQKEGVVLKEKRSGAWTPELTEAERATVFAIAEDTLAWCVNGSSGAFSFHRYNLTDKLMVPTHTFVTLKREGRLRGCIGSLPPMEAPPLYESVHQHTILAALRDRRFRQVSPAELAGIEIDVSLLSPVKDIKTIDEFVIGEHGIIVEQGGRHGVFLPEVAVEQKWTKEQTLNYVCSEKAGLSADAWRKGARMQVFSSVVISK